MIYEWDNEKNLSNFKKHGISFEDAIPIFSDEIYEDRYIKFGFAFHKGVLVVVYSEKDNCIRIISARRATKTEEKQYAQGIRPHKI